MFSSDGQNTEDGAVKKLTSAQVGLVSKCLPLEDNRIVGICGQAPSDYPEFAEFLVEEGIDSISLTPDAILKTTAHVLEVESR